jgi:hypothetical protein
MNDGTLPKHWVLLETLDDPLEGQLLREMLEQQGISCVLTQDGTAKVFGFNQNIPAELYVSPDKAEQARKLISDYFSGSATEE